MAGHLRRIPINLALQGGGAHGAFTWGVLDRLLEEPRLRIGCVSAASAGAVNAVALAAGWIEGGPAGARAKLDAVWDAVLQAQVPDFMRGMARISMTQIMNLMLLAPDVQSSLILRERSRAKIEALNERALRALTSEVSWTSQRTIWKRMLA